MYNISSCLNKNLRLAANEHRLCTGRPIRIPIRYEKLKSCHLNRSFSICTTKRASDAPRTIFSGIQPTGVPHLGNYLGALKEWVRLQDTATEGTRLVFSIVDLHALTVPQERCQLRDWRKQMLAALIAVGLDPNRSTLFYQSAVRCAALIG